VRVESEGDREEEKVSEVNILKVKLLCSAVFSLAPRCSTGFISSCSNSLHY
jgi:hypothetical protein